MNLLNSQFRYYVYRQVTDFRKGIDGLVGLVYNELGHDPLKGDVFVFFNRKRDQVRLLQWDRSGYVLCSKRLEEGNFSVPLGSSITLKWEELVLILEGISMAKIIRKKRYFRVEKQG